MQLRPNLNQLLLIFLVSFLLVSSTQAGHQPELRILSAGAWQESIVVPSPSGDWVFLGYSELGKEDTILLLETATGRSIKLDITRVLEQSNEWSVHSAKWSPNGDVIAVEFVGDDVAVTLLYYRTTRIFEKLNYDGRGSNSGEWLPDGKVFCYTPGVNDPEAWNGVFCYRVREKTLISILEGKYVGELFLPASDMMLGLLEAGSCNQAGSCLFSIPVATALANGREVAKWDAKKGELVATKQSAPASPTP